MIGIAFYSEAYGASIIARVGLSTAKKDVKTRAAKRILSNAHVRWLSPAAGLLQIAAVDTLDAKLKLGEAGISPNDLLYIEPDYKRKAMALPNDAFYSSQWALPAIGFDSLWDANFEKENIVVAVIDTGIDLTHPDLQNRIWTNPDEDWSGGTSGNNNIDDDRDGYVDNYYGVNVLTGRGNPIDDNGHGTEVAGIIGANCNNALGICGVSSKAVIMPIKVLDNIGSGTTSDFIAAVDYVIRYRKKTGKPIVINASLGGAGFSQAEHDIIASAGAEGILVIAAAGNDHVDNDTSPTYPASYDLPNIISVAAVGSDMQLAYYSNWGKTSVDLAAPGSNVYSTKNNGGYGSGSGTSFSTPFVAGTAAMLISNCPVAGLKVKDAILNSASQQTSLASFMTTSGVLSVADAAFMSAASQTTYQLNLIKGENLISLPVTPCFTGAKTFASGGAFVSSIWSYKDNQWRGFFQNAPSFSDSQSLSAGLGYWIEAADSATVTVVGMQSDIWPTISSGWNLVGFPVGQGTQISDVLTQHYTGVMIESVWGYEGGQWHAYFPDNPGVSDLGLVEHDRAYWIKIK